MNAMLHHVNGPINVDGNFKALNFFKCKKAAGVDGISDAFYSISVLINIAHKPI